MAKFNKLLDFNASATCMNRRIPRLHRNPWPSKRQIVPISGWTPQTALDFLHVAGSSNAAICGMSATEPFGSQIGEFQNRQRCRI